MFDLLNKKQRLRVLEDAHGIVQVVGLKEEPVNSAEDVLSLIRMGSVARCAHYTTFLIYMLSFEHCLNGGFTIKTRLFKNDDRMLIFGVVHSCLLIYFA